jgi:hypothetical protein
MVVHPIRVYQLGIRYTIAISYFRSGEMSKFVKKPWVNFDPVHQVDHETYGQRRIER